MAHQEFRMPKMGESITEATILTWLKSVGDPIAEDEILLEIATDKVDSELPSPFEGIVKSILFKEGDVVEVGKVIAIIDSSSESMIDEVPGKASDVIEKSMPSSDSKDAASGLTSESKRTVQPSTQSIAASPVSMDARPSISKRFYSPLIRAIAEIEQLSIGELDSIEGKGAGGRVTKADIVAYVSSRSAKVDKERVNYIPSNSHNYQEGMSVTGDIEIVEMDRTRLMIADHMVRSKHTSPHVTSFLEIDVTNIVEWRDQVKNDFFTKFREKITYTPIFIEAVARAIRDFPGINASVDKNKIIIKKFVNIGMATATDKGNLIVPVIKSADTLNIVELTQRVNDLANRARTGGLQPDEVQNGTFTLTNVGTFGNTMGTPIINQPQVAIMSTGAINKKAAVIETPTGDQIVIRKCMFLSLSYDHRIVDGALGGQFLRRVGDYLEGFNVNRKV